MLLNFSLSNFRSYKEQEELSLIPSGKIKKRPNMPGQSVTYSNLYALNSVIIYGPNNSGKSNLLKGLRALKWMIVNSNSFQPGTKLDMNDFFYFDLNNRALPTSFEIDFISPANQLRYQYSIVFNQKEILEEELRFVPEKSKGRETAPRLFYRKGKEPIKYGEYYKGEKKAIEKVLLPNQLFLSKAVNNNQEQLVPAFLFFMLHLNLSNFSIEENSQLEFSNLGKMISEDKDNPITSLIEKLLYHLDTGILGIEVAQDGELPTVEFPDGFDEDEKKRVLDSFVSQFKYKIRTKHRLFENGKEIGTDTLPLEEQSDGTKKFFSLIRAVLVSLRDGDTLIIDELDKSLHPRLTKAIVELFHNETTNQKNAQLIFVTHDPSLLDSSMFSRDQIYIVEKNEYGASELFPISLYKGVRENTPFDKWYLHGKFGGVPAVNKTVIYSEIAKTLFHGEA